MKNRRERKKMAALRDNEVKKEKIEQEKQAEQAAETLVHDGENVGTNEGEKSLEQALNEVDP